MTDWETLREKAERVNTWGENWSTSFDDRTRVRDVYDRLVASVEGVDEADYIAAADPPTVLALLDDLDRAEAEVKRLREGIAKRARALQEHADNLRRMSGGGWVEIVVPLRRTADTLTRLLDGGDDQ